jgi:AraC family transcriptional regulator, alkane utilization regulator
MDALSEVLKVCRLRGAVVSNADFGAPWRLAVSATAPLVKAFLPDAESPAVLHLILAGECLVEAFGSDPLRLRAGEAILLVKGTPHRLASDMDAPEATFAGLVKPPLAGELVPVRHGGSGARTRIVTCLAAMERPLCDPILEALPALVRVDLKGSPSSRMMEDALGFALSKSDAPRAGGLATLSKLSEILFIDVVRKQIEATPPDAMGWIAGLNDRYVGRALALMHARPGDDWTVEKLARQVGLSRSALAERFVQVLAEPPITYLSRWRLRLAAQKLVHTRRTIESIATDAGYESSGAFSHAFKRTFGKPPSIWRKSKNRDRSLSRGKPGPLA